VKPTRPADLGRDSFPGKLSSEKISRRRRKKLEAHGDAADGAAAHGRRRRSGGAVESGEQGGFLRQWRRQLRPVAVGIANSDILVFP